MTDSPDTSSPVSDDSLIRDTLDGNSAAFGTLVRKHERTMLDLALRMVHIKEEAEDVVQQVFVEAYRHLADFRHGSQFSTWLYSIGLNRSRNHLRSRKIRQTVPLDATSADSDDKAVFELPDKTPLVEQQLEKKFDLEWIQQQVKTLSPEFREIFILHYFQGLSLSEIAKRLGRPLGTVKVYLLRARRELYHRRTGEKIK